MSNPYPSKGRQGRLPEALEALKLLRPPETRNPYKHPKAPKPKPPPKPPYKPPKKPSIKAPNNLKRMPYIN